MKRLFLFDEGATEKVDGVLSVVLFRAVLVDRAMAGSFWESRTLIDLIGFSWKVANGGAIRNQ